MLLIYLVAALSLGAAQHEHPGAASQPAAELLPGLGHLHHEIKTDNADAQKFFDQGLTLVYGFNHDEAIRSFRRAAELDPRSPMPHWGIALALGPNINLDVDPAREKAAYEEAQRAMALAGNGTPAERAYAEALTKRYSMDPKADLKALAAEYRNAMRDVVRRFPDDLDAATLYAESIMDLRPWQLWSSDGKPAEGTEELLSVLEGVLKRDQNHVGANHYYIHAVEASPNPGRALPSAARLDSLVPNAGHLVHMPAHIYMRTGDYAGAVMSNTKAAKVDRDYIEKTKPEGVYPAMYYAHNLDFLASAAMMTGQFGEAARSADEVVSLVSGAVDAMPMIEPFGAKKLYVLLRFAKWDDVLALPEPDAKRTILATLSHFGRGVAHARRGDVAAAERERAADQTAKTKLAPDLPWNYNTASGMLAVTDGVLEARIASAKGDADAAISAWNRGVAAQDALNYDEPPDWYYPVRESLGAELIRARRFSEAEAVFREDLKRNPRNPRSLFGVWQALLAQKKPEANAMEKAFRQASRQGDVELRLDDF
jgi:tetratricopeptide (TPR) repeat protein